MKKSYFLFAFILVVLILAFSFTRSYLNSLEESAKGTKNQTVSRATLDSLERELTTRFNEYEAFVDQRLDSFARQVRETKAKQDSLTADTAMAIPTDEKLASKASALPNKKSKAPSGEETAIYQEYLKRRLGLPTDLSAYELKIAKNEILIDLGKAHNMSTEQVLDVVDRVFENRKKSARN